MKGKVIDFDMIEEHLKPNTDKNIRVTGNSNKGGILVTSEDMKQILTEHTYLATDSVDAGLLLLDKRLNNENDTSPDTINVYSVHELRLILAGEGNAIIKPGKFICIMPRSFELNDFETQRKQIMEQKDTGHNSVNGGHFTLVSNLHCDTNEVKVYETFGPYRQPNQLLTTEGKQLIRNLLWLSDTDNEQQQIKVKCINVVEQTESECGALAFAIGLQLCFHHPTGGVHHFIQNVRQHMLFCLQQNELRDFVTEENVVDHEVIFSIKI